MQCFCLGQIVTAASASIYHELLANINSDVIPMGDVKYTPEAQCYVDQLFSFCLLFLKPWSYPETDASSLLCLYLALY